MKTLSIIEVNEVSGGVIVPVLRGIQFGLTYLAERWAATATVGAVTSCFFGGWAGAASYVGNKAGEHAAGGTPTTSMGGLGISAAAGCVAGPGLTPGLMLFGFTASVATGYSDAFYNLGLTDGSAANRAFSGAEGGSGGGSGFNNDSSR